MEIDDDMEPDLDNVPSVDTPAAYTLCEGQTWGWDGIDGRAVLAQNQNEPSFKNGWSPQSLSYIDIFLHCLPFKWFRIVPIPSTTRAMTEADIASLTLGYLLRYLGLLLLMYTCSGWKREKFWSVDPFDQEANPRPYRLGEFMPKCQFNDITRELRFNNTNPPPYVDKFCKIIQMVKA